MARSYRTKANDRASEHVRVIRDHLNAGEAAEAVAEASRSVRGELAHMCRRRPADGMFAAAQVAGLLQGIASVLHNYKPHPADDLRAVLLDAIEKGTTVLTEEGRHARH